MRLPMWLLFAIATGYEAYARITGRPVLISLASVRLLARENERSRFDHAKTERELGVSFRPFEETVADVIAWYRDHGDLPRPANPSTGPAPSRKAESAAAGTEAT
jgi:dihydroflavonol-4-reductase